jgi:hypothetical protein
VVDKAATAVTTATVVKDMAARTAAVGATTVVDKAATAVTTAAVVRAMAARMAAAGPIMAPETMAEVWAFPAEAPTTGASRDTFQMAAG